MEEFRLPETILYFVGFEISGWFQMIFVTDEELIVTSVKASDQTKVMRALCSEEDMIRTLRKFMPVGVSLGRVQLVELQSAEVHEDAPALTVRYRDTESDRSSKLTWSLPTTEDAWDLMAAMESVIGGWKMSSEAESIWHIGVEQLVYATIALLSFTALTIASYVEADDPRRSPLTDVLGAGGFAICGLGIVAAMMVWWWIKCQNAPKKMIAHPMKASDFDNPFA